LLAVFFSRMKFLPHLPVCGDGWRVRLHNLPSGSTPTGNAGARCFLDTNMPDDRSSGRSPRWLRRPEPLPRPPQRWPESLGSGARLQALRSLKPVPETNQAPEPKPLHNAGRKNPRVPLNGLWVPRNSPDLAFFLQRTPGKAACCVAPPRSQRPCGSHAHPTASLAPSIFRCCHPAPRQLNIVISQRALKKAPALHPPPRGESFHGRPSVFLGILLFLFFFVLFDRSTAISPVRGYTGLIAGCQIDRCSRFLPWSSTISRGATTTKH